MKNSKLTKSIVALVALAVLATTTVPTVATAQSTTGSNSVDTYVGELKYLDQTLTMQSVKKLHKRMRLQRAAQLVMWSYPMVQFTNAIEIPYSNLGNTRDETNIGIFKGIGTYPYFSPNMVTPYTIGSMDLSVTGPVVLKIPEGHIYGVANNLWQQPIKEFGSGKAETFLFVGPGQKYPEDFDGEIVQSDTYQHLWYYRVLGTGPEAEALVTKVRIYPLAKADNPPKNRFTNYTYKEGDVVNTPPKGMAYWEKVNDYVQNEPMHDRDRFFYGWLADLGIEKGKEFKPTNEQKAVFLEGLKVGLAMAQANSVHRRFKGAPYGNSKWKDLFAGLDPAVDLDNKSLFDERLSYLYEGTTMSSGMKGRTAGKGSAYLTAYYDADSNPLQGGNQYKLHVEPDVPAANFWSMTLYSMETKLCIDYDGRRVDFNSRDKDLQYNEDGSLDLYFGPSLPKTAPKSNWIQTNPGQSWFTYFRLYGPLQSYMDEIWPMNEIERVK